MRKQTGMCYIPYTSHTYSQWHVYEVLSISMILILCSGSLNCQLSANITNTHNVTVSRMNCRYSGVLYLQAVLWMLLFVFPISEDSFGITENIPFPSQQHPKWRFLMRWRRATDPGPPSRAGTSTDAKGSSDQSVNQSDWSTAHNEDLFNMLCSYMTSHAVIHVRLTYQKEQLFH